VILPRVWRLTAILVVCGMAWGAARGGEALVVSRGAALPSSLRYALLNDVARRLEARVVSDTGAGTFSIEREGRRVVVVPGVGAALVGSRVVVLSREVVARYGRVYVPRSVVGEIERYLRGREPEPAPEKPTPVPSVRRGVGADRLVRRVCIDPGHGGKDPGAVSRWGLREKDVVLSLSRRLASELRSRGFEVVMTRTSDVFIELNDRPAIAARRGADVFVSIHANACSRPSVDGVEIFHCDGRYDPVAMAAAARSAGRGPDAEDVGGPVGLNAGGSQAVLEMLFEEYHRESRLLSSSLERSFVRSGRRVHSTRTAGYRVLRLAEMPAVLVEVGFLTNRADERRLRTSSFQQQTVRAIASGMEAFRDAVVRTHGYSR